MRLLPMLSSPGGLQPVEGSAYAGDRPPLPTCHPERARRASRRTPIVEAISDSRLDYFRGPTPTGIAGLHVRVSIGLVTGHGFSRAGCAFFLCCHHEEGFSPTRDLLLPATAHHFRRVILSEPAGRVEGPLSWKQSAIRGWTIFAGPPRLVVRAFSPASALAS